MKTRPILIPFLVVLVALFVSAACGKAADRSEPEVAESPSIEGYRLADAAPAAPAATKALGAVTDRSKADAEERSDDRTLSPILAFTNAQTTERLLEYQVTLGFECDDLAAARLALIGLVGKYGFIMNSSADASGRRPSMNIGLAVKSGRLYDALQDFDRLGKLLSENINVNDLTEEMQWAGRKAERENIRIRRRQLAVLQTPTGNEGFTDRENALASSEDELDQKEHAKWKVRDRVSWARVTIALVAPAVGDEIEVPNYGNALKGALNVLLEILYGVLYLVPLVLLGWGLFLGGRRIWRRLRKQG
jgi:hypothetical protein